MASTTLSPCLCVPFHGRRLNAPRTLKSRRLPPIRSLDAQHVQYDFAVCHLVYADGWSPAVVLRALRRVHLPQV